VVIVEKWHFSTGNAGSKLPSTHMLLCFKTKICLMSVFLRSINYDGLDAFLCVECGYCMSGGFSYELTAGLALSAIAILDEDG